MTQLIEPATSTVRAADSRANVVIHLIGTPGCGKTALIEATAQRLTHNHSVTGALVVHPAASRDAAALRFAGAHAVAVDEPFDPDSLNRAIESMPRRVDLLFIEASNLALEFAAPTARVAVFSVTGGDSKAAELAGALRDADLVVLTKCDLLPHVKFDLELFRNDVKRAGRDIGIIELSSADGTGLTQWTDWLLARVIETRTTHDPGLTPDAAEWWFG